MACLHSTVGSYITAVAMHDLTWVPVATAVTGDFSDIGDGDGELSPDDLPPDDVDGLPEDVGEEEEEEPETGVISQRSKPDPVSELTKLVGPQPPAELTSHVLELR